MRLTRPGARKTRGRVGKCETNSCARRAGESVIFSIAKRTLSLARIGQAAGRSRNAKDARKGTDARDHCNPLHAGNQPTRNYSAKAPYCSKVKALSSPPCPVESKSSG